jgi:hypothetical protein
LTGPIDRRQFASSDVSTTFQISIHAPVGRSLIDPGLADLRWYVEEPPDPLTVGTWNLFRAGISTRMTTVAYAPGGVTVTLRSGACAEDCELALGIVQRVAREGDSGRIDCEFGSLTCDELGDIFNDAWVRDQLESAARITGTLARERGPIAMPGPTRKVWIGPRVISELEQGNPGLPGERLVAIMRRVLWPNARYEPAGEFQARSPDGERITLVILIPDRPCILPHSDRVAIADADHVIVIPRSALPNLPIEITWLDDRNQLLEAINGDRWPAICQAARAYKLAT